MIDRVAIAGWGGTFASFGLGSIHEWVGIIAGLLTIVYMLVKIYKNLSEYKNDVSMLMQVHDELVFEIRENSIDKYTKIIQEIMEYANLPKVSLNVNLKVDTGFGDNWAEAH